MPLQLAADQQIEFLVRSPQLNVRFERHGIVALRQGIHQFVQRDRFFFLETLMKVIALEHLRYRDLGGQLDEIGRREFREPPPVEIYDGLVSVQDFEYLRFVGFSVLVDFFTTEEVASRSVRWGRR